MPFERLEKLNRNYEMPKKKNLIQSDVKKHTRNYSMDNHCDKSFSEFLNNQLSLDEKLKEFTNNENMVQDGIC